MLPLSKFYRRGDKGYQHNCIECVKKIRINRNYNSLYGISRKQYDAMVEKQNNLCAICNREERVERNGKIMALSVDHCNETLTIRALLCAHCNRALGLFDHSIELLQAAISYLEKYDRIMAESGG